MIEEPFIHRNKHLKTTKEVVDAAVRKLREEKIPNPLYSDFYEDNGMFVPLQQEEQFPLLTIPPFSYKFFYSVSAPPSFVYFSHSEEEDAEEIPEPEYEVNLMEALVGWRAWEIEDGKLLSPTLSTSWIPGQPLEAHCRTSGFSFCDPKKVIEPCNKPPVEDCGCGIYASSREEVEENYLEGNERILGEVYGWGRYVRGDIGWRAQYAYPKCFYLKANQMNHVDLLRTFHVPIYVEQPIKIYNPQEDGYENRNDEAHGYFGAGEVTDAGEEDRASNTDD